MYVDAAFLAYHDKPERARLRGLARNAATPVDVLLRLLDHPEGVRPDVTRRPAWSDEAVDAVAAHPRPAVRAVLAEAVGASPEQRARLVDDPDRRVRWRLAEGPDRSRWAVAAPLPRWAYERLAGEGDDLMRDLLANWCRWTPADIRAALRTGAAADPSGEARNADGDAPLTRERAEELVRDESEWARTQAAADPALPADLVAVLATDPSPDVRLAVSMRPELSEEQPAAVDYHVAPADRLTPLDWVTETTDPDVLRRCVHSAHVALRRSSAYNPHLTPELVAVLAADEDHAVRLLLCENHPDVPGEVVLQTYLEAEVAGRGDLLDHPCFPRQGLASLADSPDPNARALVVLDPQAPAALIERLSHDPDPRVRCRMAADERLPLDRLLALFDDPETTEAAASNPNLPVDLMERILADALP
ncbi:hypothetical protein [Micromonospora sp. NPDC048830]|uniref:hypothetical protein n=1 Tax=Micromonospora sp. NPDC048830 TaxID=3364257 RepID=UPI0037167A15